MLTFYPTAGCIRFQYVLFLANEQDLWFYMADSLNWCNIEIYAGMCSLGREVLPTNMLYSDRLQFSFNIQGNAQSIRATILECIAL